MCCCGGVYCGETKEVSLLKKQINEKESRSVVRTYRSAYVVDLCRECSRQGVKIPTPSQQCEKNF